MSLTGQFAAGAIGSLAFAASGDLLSSGATVDSLIDKHKRRLCIVPEDSNDLVKCSYNPSSITMSRTTGWKDTAVQHMPVPKKSWGSGGTTVLSLSVMFRSDTERALLDRSGTSSGFSSRLSGLIGKLPLVSDLANVISAASAIAGADSIDSRIASLKKNVRDVNTNVVNTEDDIMLIYLSRFFGFSYPIYDSKGLALKSGPPVLSLYFDKSMGTFISVLKSISLEFVQFSSEMKPMMVIVKASFEQFQQTTMRDNNSYEIVGGKALNWLF